MKRLPFLDSHTGGEPTRLIENLPFALQPGTVAQRLAQLQQNYDHLRRTVLNEPRGSEVMVGAYLLPPSDPTCQWGVVFFNNVGYLGMCGHGTIGLVASLAYRGLIQPGTLRLETPVGIVQATLHPGESPYPNRVSVQNVPAYRYRAQVPVTVNGRTLYGDVAWGGNWFFLVYEHGYSLQTENLPALTHYAGQIRQALAQNGITGADGAEIDHVELFAPTQDADSQSFVLCPGNAYDRSPCGTGTSAKLACLYADGSLAPGKTWRQKSIIGSLFEGSITLQQGQLIPTITGEAWVMAEGNLLIDERDPFGQGIP